MEVRQLCSALVLLLLLLLLLLLPLLLPICCMSDVTAGMKL
jgi:hypothetical protein